MMIEEIQYREMARSYDMVCRFRDIAEQCGEPVFLREMTEQKNNMEAWGKRLGINLREIADNYYSDL
ncbi:MAG TPA: hypothetical protein VK469_16725 [Candidatus Kapabacteria bacterium]|nr:hypothetical protein [Candidatus Kapabacteria bacterium]